MSVVEVLEQLGGVADYTILCEATPRSKVRRALRAGLVVRDARGRYSLRTAEIGLRAARRLTAIASHRSAAAHWGWEMKRQPQQPAMTVPRNRNLPAKRREGLDVHFADLRDDEVAAPGVTTRERTVVDCMRALRFDEALAIADSALRHRDLTKHRLLELAAAVTGKGGKQARRVAAAASAKAANPFESVLRAIALEVPGLQVEPQVVLHVDGHTVRPDLVDLSRRLVVEAESFEWHGRREALDRDCIRYNVLSLGGWTILRFSWEQVMRRPWYVRRCLITIADSPRPRTVKQANRRRPARKCA